MKFYLIAFLYRIAIPLQYKVIAKLMLIFDNEYQPVVAFFLLIAKKINTRIHNRLIAKAAYGDKSGSALLGTYNIAVLHALFTSYAMGSVATYATAWFVVGCTFANNIHTCVQLVKGQV